MRRAAVSVALVACRATTPPVLANTGTAGPATLAIHLERTECLGNACPTYTIDIATDGSVAWHGEDNVAKPGAARAQIAARDVDQLIAAFERASFFTLERAARSYVECTPTCVTIICDVTDRSTTKVAIRGKELEIPDCHGELDAAVRLLNARVGAAAWIGPRT